MAIFDPMDNVIYEHLWEVIPGSTAIVKGDPAVIQDTFGFYLKDVESVTEEVCFVFAMRQVRAAKSTGTGTAILRGDRLYYYPATQTVSPTPTGTAGVDYYYCGIALRSASATATTVLMKFDGTRYDETI